jgi:hypothetical protein
MGYTIDYTGRFNLNKPLTEEHAQFLKDFSKTRHYHRAWKPEEENGIWFVDPECKLEPDFFDEEYKKVLYAIPYNNEKRKAYELEKWGCISINEVNPGMPSFYCQWVPTEDMTGIEWDGGEKFYQAKEWIKFLIKNYLKPWGYILNGKVYFQNGYHEYDTDCGAITAENNEIITILDEEDY